MRKIYGLTGGIGSGKSTVSKMFLDAGIPVIDCDLIVHNIYENPTFIEEIKNSFGTEFIINNKVDKRKLGEYVFSNTKELKKLNSLIHPIVFDSIDVEIETYQSDIVVIDMPLLYEVKYKKCDMVIVVYSTLEERVDRIIKRDKCTKEYALEIIKAQMPLEDKVELADYVIDNSNSIKETEKQFKDLLKML